jgi:PhnB protein
MAKVSTYLNFMGNTEEAFTFYKSVFGTEFEAPIQYMREIPADPTFPPRTEQEEGMVMHVALPILGGHRLLGTDMLESMGHKLHQGNNVTLNLEPDTRAETERLFHDLAAGGTIDMPLTVMFWGGYFGSVQDKFGIRWMLNCASAT